MAGDSKLGWIRCLQNSSPEFHQGNTRTCASRAPQQLKRVTSNSEPMPLTGLSSSCARSFAQDSCKRQESSKTAQDVSRLLSSYCHNSDSSQARGQGRSLCRIQPRASLKGPCAIPDDHQYLKKHTAERFWPTVTPFVGNWGTHAMVASWSF